MSTETLLGWSVYVTVGLSFGFLAAALLRAFGSGAETYAGTYSASTARQFEDIFLFIPPRRIAEIGWAAAIGMSLVCFLASGGVSGSVPGMLVRLALAIGLGGGPMLLAPAYTLVFLRDRRRRRFNLQLIDALANMGNALKSGFSIMQAFEHVVENGDNPISQEFDTFLHQTRVGVGFSEALRNLDERVGSDDLTLVVLSIETARRTGGNLTEIFDKISMTIRERIRIENRIRTLTAQGRLQGIVVGVMPLVIGVALNILQPAMFKPFIESSVGIVVIAVVAVLLVAGALSIRKIIHIDV
jgi:tight adherence protein B